MIWSIAQEAQSRKGGFHKTRKLTGDYADDRLKTASRTIPAASCALHTMEVSHEVSRSGDWRKIFAKKRCIDPYVRGQGRVSELDAGFAAQLHAFRTQSQDYWVRGR